LEEDNHDLPRTNSGSERAASTKSGDERLGTDRLLSEDGRDDGIDSGSFGEIGILDGRPTHTDQETIDGTSKARRRARMEPERRRLTSLQIQRLPNR
jgi:hypothetical protein